ncbi:GNAT family N-acetyltransferase [Rhizobium sp. C4]|uniref:GNAT family N-acetyltransferase n=1 Tax=Rhizobium sp. C4 TaxID=1349800 RepID=UPI001E637C7B|nr:GNAT family N-acetyltransferase [Rhizobium sp. C4]MCD2172026.1 GNAT family N-acetyltransferase [Rhizobium sp. C4]
MVRRPAPLGIQHRLDGFDSGKPDLDHYLRDIARANHENGLARSFVIADADFTVVGYYSLAAAMISRNEAPRNIGGHGSPRDIPVALLARLAVDRRHQGRGLGAQLLRAALLSVLAGAEHVAFRAVMVHALDDEATRFYAKYGFRAAKGSERTLLLPLQDVTFNLKS